MKVKVILRAPKSQIPLYMTLNDAKFGNEQVATSLNVVESNEVVQWVNNNVARHGELNIAPQKQIEISQELASSLSRGLSEILKNKVVEKSNVENIAKDTRNPNFLPYYRHKYKIAYLKDILPNDKTKSKSLNNNKDLLNNETVGILNDEKVENKLNNVKKEVILNNDKIEDKTIVEKKELIQNPQSELIEESEKTSESRSEKDFYENDERLNKFKSLISLDLNREFSSSMGANLGTKYNGKEMKSNIRKKFISNSVFKNKKSYDYNKKFRSNNEYSKIFDFEDNHCEYVDSCNHTNKNNKIENDNLSDSEIDSDSIQKVIKKDIENALKIDAMEKDIVQKFQNLTINPYLFKKVDKICEKDNLINSEKQVLDELTEKVSIENDLQVSDEKLYLNKDLKNFNKELKRNDLDIELSNALSRLNFELLNTNKVLDRCLKEGFSNSKILNDEFIKDSLKKLDNFDFFYKKMQLLFLNKPFQEKNSQFHLDQINKFHFESIDQLANIFNGYDNEINDVKSYIYSNKVPDTNLPLLSEVDSQKKPGTSLLRNSLSKQSSSESSMIMNKRQDSKRSLSVPIHEKKFEKLPNNNINSQDNINSDKIRNRSLNNNRINHKLPQTKVGLKPNLSSEGLYLNNEERGRTKIYEKNNSKITRDFVAENKSNVILNATKTSSSLQINTNKKNKLTKKKSSNRNVSCIDNTNNKLRDNQDYRRNQIEIYPSLEVGGPIARMNGACGFIPCFQEPYHPRQFDCYMNEKLNNYYHFNSQKVNVNTSYLDERTPRCPYWCNLIART